MGERGVSGTDGACGDSGTTTVGSPDVAQLLASGIGTTLARMEQRDVGTPVTQRFSRRSAWRHVGVALLLVILAHQIILATPLNAIAPAMAATNQQSNIGMPCNGSCPTGIVSLCIPGRICAGVAATLTRLPFAPLMLALLLVLGVLATRTPILRLRRERWLWPPDRRRAFLQVFLI